MLKKKKNITNEKETRDKQLKDILLRRKYELKNHKALDNYLIEKLKEEITAEKNYLQAKKIHQADIMRKVMRENDIKKKILQDEQELER